MAPVARPRACARVINDPTTGLPLPDCQISPTLFDPAAVALAKYLPQTADPCGKVTYGIPVQSNESQIRRARRLDHQPQALPLRALFRG